MIWQDAFPLASVCTVGVHVSVPFKVKVSPSSPAMGLPVMPSVSVPVTWPGSEYSPLAGVTVRTVGSMTVIGVVVLLPE